MTTDVLTSINTEKRKELGIRAGDTVRVWQKIQEKGKTRLQAFEGLVLFRKHGDTAGGTFTVRKVASGVGVEKTFPLYSPSIDKIEIVKRSKVRRAKLYYIRDKVAKEIRRAMRGAVRMGTSTGSDIAEKDEIKKAAEEAEAQATAEAEARAAEEAQAQEEVAAEQDDDGAGAEVASGEDEKKQDA